MFLELHGDCKKVQIMANKREFGSVSHLVHAQEEEFDEMKRILRRGDCVGVTGKEGPERQVCQGAPALVS